MSFVKGDVCASARSQGTSVSQARSRGAVPSGDQAVLRARPDFRVIRRMQAAVARDRRGGGAALFSLLSTGSPCSEGARGDQFRGACRAALRVGRERTLPSPGAPGAPLCAKLPDLVPALPAPVLSHTHRGSCSPTLSRPRPHPSSLTPTGAPVSLRRGPPCPPRRPLSGQPPLPPLALRDCDRRSLPGGLRAPVTEPKGGGRPGGHGRPPPRVSAGGLRVSLSAPESGA